jgi:hypothetical protein
MQIKGSAHQLILLGKDDGKINSSSKPAAAPAHSAGQSAASGKQESSNWNDGDDLFINDAAKPALVVLLLQRIQVALVAGTVKRPPQLLLIASRN